MKRTENIFGVEEGRPGPQDYETGLKDRQILTYVQAFQRTEKRFAKQSETYCKSVDPGPGSYLSQPNWKTAT